MDKTKVVRFGRFALNHSRGRLEDAFGAERFLRPKSYRVLEVLVERRGSLVSKDDLVREAWPDVIVSDDSLAHCISDIRRALGPDATKLIRTVPRRGYVLVSEEPTRREAASSTRRMGGWARLAGAPAGIALAAGLWWALPSAERPAVAPDEVSRAVARAEALLEARDWRRRADNERARDLLEAVVATEPDHATAWAGLGLTYWLEVQHLAWGGGRREMAQAVEMVERSVALGGSAGSHRLIAEMRLLAPFPEMRSPVDALASARVAAALDPDDPDNLAVLAQVLALTGRPGEAVATIEQARALDPTPPYWYAQVAGVAYLLAGEPARAAEEFGSLYGAGTFAGGRWWPGWLLAASLAHAGRTEEASRIVDDARRRRPEETIVGVAQSFDGFADPDGLSVLLEGLRLAGLPG